MWSMKIQCCIKNKYTNKINKKTKVPHAIVSTFFIRQWILGERKSLSEKGQNCKKIVFSLTTARVMGR